MRTFKIVSGLEMPLSEMEQNKMWDFLMGVQMGVQGASDFKFLLHPPKDERTGISFSSDCNKLIEQIRLEFMPVWRLEEVSS